MKMKSRMLKCYLPLDSQKRHVFAQCSSMYSFQPPGVLHKPCLSHFSHFDVNSLSTHSPTQEINDAHAPISDRKYFPHQISLCRLRSLKKFDLNLKNASPSVFFSTLTMIACGLKTTSLSNVSCSFTFVKFSTKCGRYQLLWGKTSVAEAANAKTDKRPQSFAICSFSFSKES